MFCNTKCNPQTQHKKNDHTKSPMSTGSFGILLYQPVIDANLHFPVANLPLLE